MSFKLLHSQIYTMANNLWQNIARLLRKPQSTIEFFDEAGNLKPQYNTEQFQVFEGRVVPRSVDTKQLKVGELHKFPLLNDPYQAGVFTMPFGAPPEVDRKTLMMYVKYTPEIVSIFNAIIEDIISDGYTLEALPEVRGTGKTKIAKAEEFLQKNHFKELLTSAMWDVLGTGDAYIWKGGVTQAQVKSLVQDTVDKFPIQFKSQSVEYLLEGLKQSDEDIFSTRSLELIPSTTVQIKYDQTGVISYVQRVGSNVAEFTPEEVIHMRLWRVDGKIYGYTPLQSITREIDILTNVKDYARYYFESGGVPNFLFVMEDETPDSPSYKAFKKALQMIATLRNKYKNILVTGKVNPVELNKLNNDMQFQQLAIYLTQVIVMAWQIPSSRLSDMLVAKGIRGATIATEGYYRKISHHQDILEDIINSEILASFKVRLRFNKSYLQDEVREVQIELFKRDTIEKTQSILGAYDKKLTENKILKLMGLAEEDIEEGKAEMMFPNNRQSFDKNSQLLSQDQEKLSQDKDKQSIALQQKMMDFIENESSPLVIKKLPDGSFELKPKRR